MIPLIVVLVNSLQFENRFSLHWYQEVFNDSQLVPALWRSLGLATFSGLFATFLGFLSAVTMVRLKGSIRNLISFFSLFSLVVPEIVFALALLSWFVVLGLDLSLTTVWISHVTFSVSFATFIFISRFQQLDRSLEEAGRDLGATELQILWKIIIPQLHGASIASFVLCFLISFDDFTISYYVSGIGEDTLPMKLFSSMKMGHSPKLSALSSIMSLVTLLATTALIGNRKVRASLLARKT